jgi:hypothetical protein
MSTKLSLLFVFGLLFGVLVFGQDVSKAQVTEIQRFPRGEKFYLGEEPSIVSGIGDIILLDQGVTILGG